MDAGKLGSFPHNARNAIDESISTRGRRADIATAHASENLTDLVRRIQNISLELLSHEDMARSTVREMSVAMFGPLPEAPCGKEATKPTPCLTSMIADMEERSKMIGVAIRELRNLLGLDS